MWILAWLACGEKTTEENAPPVVSAEMLTENALQGASIEFQAEYSDPDIADPTNLTIAWTVNGEVMCQDSQSSAAGTGLCALSPEESAALSLGTNELVVQVTDQGGAIGADSLLFELEDGDAPQVEINSLGELGKANEFLILEGSAEDDEDSPEQMLASWSSSLDGDLASGIIPQADGSIELSTQLSSGEHQLTLRVSDSRGLVGNAVANVSVAPPNQSPICEWRAPASGEIIASGALATFELQVSDAEDDPTELLVTWTSDIDGEFGTAAPMSNLVASLSSTELSTGLHWIEAEVTDQEGGSCTDGMAVQIGAPPEISWASPVEGSVFAEGEAVELSLIISDLEENPTDLSLTWSSDIDGSISQQNADSNGAASILATALSVGQHVLTVTAVDSQGLSASAARSITINGLPSAATLTLTPSTPTTTDDVVIDAQGATDPEGDTVSYTYFWYLAGNLSGTSSSATLPAAATTKGDTWTVHVYSNDSYSAGDFATHVFSIANSPAVVTQASISPQSPDSDTVLTCVAAGVSDADGDLTTLNHSWYVNGVLQTEQSDTLGALSFQRGDSVMCQISAHDGSAIGTPASDTVTIQNATPEVSAIEFIPATPTAQDTIGCSYAFSDNDNDADQSTIDWDVNGTSYGNGPTLSGGVVRGDTVTCTVNPNDGQTIGAALSASVTIDNSAPEIGSVSITPAQPMVGDTLSCSEAGSIDIDGDSSFTTSYQWFINGLVVHSGAQLSGGFVGGDTVLCSVVVSDGQDSSSAMTSSVSIAHSLPTVSQVMVQPSQPTAGDDILCSYSYSDVDGDADSSIVNWTINGTNAGEGHYLSDTGNQFQRGDTLSCTVEARDSQDIGNTESSASVTVVNDVPVVSSVSIIPYLVQTDSTVSLDVSVEDADPDSIALNISWYVNGVQVSTSQQLEGLAFFDRGDVLTASVQPDDGYALGSSVVSQTVTVTNADPTNLVVQVNPTTQRRVIDDLICEVEQFPTDPDGDTLQLNFSWSVDGVPAPNAQSSLYTNDSVSAAETIRWEEWTCEATADDGQGGSFTTSSTVTVTPDFTQRIGTGSAHSCFLDDLGAISCWGSNNLAQVSPVPSGVFTELMVGNNNNCALKDTGALACWGDNSSGQSSPPSGTFIQLSMAADHGCALRDDGEILCWGRNLEGEREPPAGRFVRVMTVSQLSCGIRPDGTTECWGKNNSGQAEPPAIEFYNLAFGSYVSTNYMCGLTFGNIECWGSDPALTGVVQYAPNGSFERMSFGSRHACALADDGTVQCWGQNGSGQNGPCSPGSHSVCINNNSLYISVATGANHTCAITDANGVECWGSNANGQSSPPQSLQ